MTLMPTPAVAFLAAWPYDPSLTKGHTDAMHHVNDQWDVFVCDVRTGKVTRLTDDAFHAVRFPTGRLLILRKRGEVSNCAGEQHYLLFIN